MNAPNPTAATAPRRRGFPWFPVVTVVLGAVGILWIRAQPELERNLKGWLSTLIPLLVLLLNLGWFFLTPRFSARTRLLGLTALIGLAIVGRFTLRIDGAMNGTGLPAFAWRWSGPSASGIPATAVPAPSSAPTTTRDPRLDLAIDVPQFLGAKRDGTAPNPGLATDWTPQAPRELWRRPVGLGWSAFAVVNGRAYTQEQRDTNELVTAYDLLTGTPIWEHADTTRFVEWQGGDGPRATPTVHEGRVYTMGGTGIFNCLDAVTGKPLWQHSVLVENRLGTNMWASSASPLIVDDLVVVTGGTGSGPTLLAYHRLTGVPAWTSGDDSASYASPVLTTLAGRRVILSNNARSVTAIDPSTGKLLLEHVWGSPKWPKASQPIVLGDDRIFISGGYGMGCQMVRVQANADGTLKAEQVWKGVSMKTQFNSPALRDGHLYGLDDGLLACVAADTGKRVWKDGRYGSGQTLLVGDLILVQNERGSVHLCAASPAGFQESGAIAALSSKTWNHPTLAGRILLVRNDREAACYELPGK
jgi:outer membrane protein assembly factor BamB